MKNKKKGNKNGRRLPPILRDNKGIEARALLYVVAAVTLTGWLDRPGIILEVAIYAGLGFLWALPFRSVFRGVGRPDPGTDRDPR